MDPLTLTCGVAGLGLLAFGKHFFNGGSVSSELLSHTRLNGKVVIVTGPSVGGIGHEAANLFYSKGATVILACRNLSSGEQVQQEILNHQKNNKTGSVQVMKLDLADLASVKSFSDDFLEKYDKLDILLNNAGIMLTPHSVTKQGVEIQFGTNHLGHFLLTKLLLDLIKKSNGRVINVSSRAGESWGPLTRDEATPVTEGSKKSVLSGFSSFSVDTLTNECKHVKSERLYGRSKFSNMVFTRRLEREFRADGNTTASAYSLHPGVVRTRLWRELNPLYFLVSYPFWWYGTKSAWQGAQTSIYLGIAPSSGLSGGHYYADCKLDKDNQFATDEELQDRLWNTSLELCKEYL